MQHYSTRFWNSVDLVIKCILFSLYVLYLVKSTAITKEDTVMRKAIPPQLKFEITLSMLWSFIKIFGILFQSFAVNDFKFGSRSIDSYLWQNRFNVLECNNLFFLISIKFIKYCYSLMTMFSLIQFFLFLSSQYKII